MKLYITSIFFISIFFTLFLAFPTEAKANDPNTQGYIKTAGTNVGVGGVWVKWVDGVGHYRYIRTESNGYFYFPSWTLLSDQQRTAIYATWIDSNLDGTNDTRQAGSDWADGFGCNEDLHTFEVIKPYNWIGSFSTLTNVSINNGLTLQTLSNITYDPAPAASISGPTNGVINQPLTFQADAQDGGGNLSKGYFYVATTIRNNPWPYVCPGPIYSEWCTIIRDVPLSGTTSSFSPVWTPTAPNTYYLTSNIVDGASQWCGHNPWGNPAGYGDCGSGDLITLTVSNPTPTPPQPTAPPPPTPTNTPIPTNTPTATPVPPTATPTPTTTPVPLQASCTLNGSSTNKTLAPGDPVVWAAFTSGGRTPYSYNWSGTDSLSGNTSSVSKTYTTPGIKTAQVTVTSADGQFSSPSCPTLSIQTSAWLKVSGDVHSNQ